MPYCDGIGGRLSFSSMLSSVQSAASVGCECGTGLKPCGCFKQHSYGTGNVGRVHESRGPGVY